MCLNQSVKLGVPAKWAVAGSAADFLIVVSPSCIINLSHHPNSPHVAGRVRSVPAG